MPGHEIYPISDKFSNYVSRKSNGINALPQIKRTKRVWTPGEGPFFVTVSRFHGKEGGGVPEKGEEEENSMPG